MKYLKLFESSNEYYKSVDHVPSFYGVTQNKYGNLSHQDQVRIINHFPHMLIINSSLLRYDPPKDIYIGRSYTAISRVDIKIYDAPDEWFYVYLRFVPKYGESQPHKVFECDQWEGLIRCIQEEVINIIR